MRLELVGLGWAGLVLDCCWLLRLNQPTCSLDDLCPLRPLRPSITLRFAGLVIACSVSVFIQDPRTWSLGPRAQTPTAR